MIILYFSLANPNLKKLKLLVEYIIFCSNNFSPSHTICRVERIMFSPQWNFHYGRFSLIVQRELKLMHFIENVDFLDIFTATLFTILICFLVFGCFQFITVFFNNFLCYLIRIPDFFLKFSHIFATEANAICHGVNYSFGKDSRIQRKLLKGYNFCSDLLHSVEGFNMTCALSSYSLSFKWFNYRYLLSKQKTHTTIECFVSIDIGAIEEFIPKIMTHSILQYLLLSQVSQSSADGIFLFIYYYYFNFDLWCVWCNNTLLGLNYISC